MSGKKLKIIFKNVQMVIKLYIDIEEQKKKMFAQVL